MTDIDILTAIRSRQAEVQDRLAALKEELMSLSQEIDDLHTAERVVQKLTSAMHPSDHGTQGQSVEHGRPAGAEPFGAQGGEEPIAPALATPGVGLAGDDLGAGSAFTDGP